MRADGDWSGPLFVVGASRSGTAMLRSILNSNSAVMLAGETHFFDDLQRIKGNRGAVSLGGREAEACADYFLALDDRPYGMKGVALRSPTSRQHLMDRASQFGGDAEAYLEAYCRIVAEREGKYIWGEKLRGMCFVLRKSLHGTPKPRSSAWFAILARWSRPIAIGAIKAGSTLQRIGRTKKRLAPRSTGLGRHTTLLSQLYFGAPPSIVQFAPARRSASAVS